MKKKSIFIIAIMFGIIGLLSVYFLNQNRVSKVVVMKGNTFEPAKFSVKKGTRVIFKNQSTKSPWPASDYHPTHGIYPEFDSLKGVELGGEWAFVFDKVGRWRFHDHLNPVARGTITVTK